MELFIYTVGALISIMNPLGTVPVFVSLLQNSTKKEQSFVALKTALNVLVILILSFFFGKYLLSFFGITINSLRIAGGLIITLSGFSLLTGKFIEHKGMKKTKVKEDIKSRSEISLTPLALPMLAGPGTISLLITYNQEFTEFYNVLYIVSAIFISSVLIFIILNYSNKIAKFLGASGINALSRIIGFIVISIGIEYISSSVLSTLKNIL